MKITRIDVIRLNAGLPGTSGTAWNPTAVRVHTDEGITGLGEIGLSFGAAKHGSYGQAMDFARLVIGMNPFHNEEIWEKLYRTTYWAQGGGTIIFGAMSAIDIALWDIKGKALGVPVHTLLGGKTNTRLRAYASQIQNDWGARSRPLTRPGEYAEATRKAMADGYTCVKVDPICFDQDGVWMGARSNSLLAYPHLKSAVDRVAAIREAGGEALDIIIELHSFSDVSSAIQICRELEPLRCYYCEEAAGPLNPDNLLEISQKTCIPQASGERIYTRWGYLPFFKNRSLRIIQPDLGNCGGLTEGKKICDMANIYDIVVQPHVCGSPLAIAATLQLEAAIPNFLIHEHYAGALLPENIALCTHDYQPKNGYIDVPDLPGMGQELTEQALTDADIATIT